MHRNEDYMRRKKFLLLLVVTLGMMTIYGGCSSNDADEPKETKEETTKKNEKEEETIDWSKITFDNDSEDDSVRQVLETILGDNESADSVVFNLNFPYMLNEKVVSYEIIQDDVISYKGEIISDLAKEEEVIVVVDYRTGKWYFKFNVLSATDAGPYKVNNIADNLIHNTDNIKGNITLPETAGENNDISIEWSCDRTDLITMEKTGANGEIPAGVVTRGAADQKVKLTAVLKSGEYSYTKEFDLTIKAKPAKKEYAAYLYTYFRGNIYGNGESQHIHIATSTDGFFWTALNDNEPILKAELGTKGVRDSYLIRSPEGDHFYLIGTDLDANGGDWGAYGGNGSRYIRIWESDDLVNWSEERLVLIAPENAACMWAPETTYDPTTGEYVVYWATGLKGGDGKKIWYAKTRDFYTFTEPQIYKNTEGGITFIDTSITEYQGVYYRFTKNENELSILLETSDKVLGEYSLVKKQIAGEFGVEGPAIYRINGEEKWVLYMDGYTGVNSGVGYFPLVANSLEDLKSGNFVRMNKGEYEMPAGAKHGSFVPITQEEYDALQTKWGK